VLGYETQRVTYTYRMLLRTSIGDRRQTVDTRSVTEALVAPALAEELGAGSVMSLASNGAAALAELILNSREGSLTPRSATPIPRGLAMRTITHSETQTTGGGFIAATDASERSVSTDTAEVISIERRRIDPRRFVVPSNYREDNLGEMLKDIAKFTRSVQGSGTGIGTGKGGRGSKTSKPNKP
jgi:hypothetical protein